MRIIDNRADNGTYTVITKSAVVRLDFDGPPKRCILIIEETRKPKVRRFVWDYDMPRVWAALGMPLTPLPIKA
jgi:hypothetical protein